MKHTLIQTLAVLGTAAALQADVIVTQESEVAGKKTRTTMSIKGEMVRTDSGTEASVIIDTATGNMTTLMHEEKMVATVDGAALKAAQATQPPAKVEAPKLTATGKTEKFGGYDCEIYTMEASGMTTKMWITKSYPGYEKLKKELATLEKMGGPGNKLPEMPGLALKTEMESNGLKFVTTLISIKDEKVDEAVFKIPSGYKK